MSQFQCTNHTKPPYEPNPMISDKNQSNLLHRPGVLVQYFIPGRENQLDSCTGFFNQVTFYWLYFPVVSAFSGASGASLPGGAILGHLGSPALRYLGYRGVLWSNFFKKLVLQRNL